MRVTIKKSLRSVGPACRPNNTGPDIITKRVQCAKKFLSDFDRTDSRRLFEIVTGDETWVRYSEPLSKEANKIWIAKGQDPPMIPRHDFRNPKVMYCIFFDSYGPVCQICVPKNTTITGSFYLNECLSEVEKFYHNRRPRTGTRGLRLLHDNARPHKTKLVREKLESMRVVELDHPPYSPDLAPCDFWLFPKLKKTPVREEIRKSGSPWIGDFPVYESYTTGRLQKSVFGLDKEAKTGHTASRRVFREIAALILTILL